MLVLSITSVPAIFNIVCQINLALVVLYLSLKNGKEEVKCPKQRLN